MSTIIGSKMLAEVIGCAHNQMLYRVRELLGEEIEDGEIQAEYLDNGNVNFYYIPEEFATLIIYRWCRGRVRVKEAMDELQYRVLKADVENILRFGDEDTVAYVSDEYTLSKSGEKFLLQTLLTGSIPFSLLCKIMEVEPFFFAIFLDKQGLTFDNLEINPYID